MVRATFMPRPPPPNAALIAIGRPYSLANATTSSAFLHRVRGAGHQRRLGACGDVAGGHLVAEIADRLRARPDPDQPGVDDRLREIGVLRKESVARVDGVGAGLLRGVEQLAEVEVGLRRRLAAEREGLVGEPYVRRVGVGLGVHGHACKPGVLGRPDHPDRDLPTIGDEHLEIFELA